MPKYNWTRVQYPNGGYGYVKTDNNDQAIEYKRDGTFKVYSQPNEKSHSFFTSFETKPRTIQRAPDDHEAHLAQQRQVDEKVRQVTPSAGQLFNVATVGGLNNLSPTQWMRRAYDTGQLIQGHMPLNEYMNKLYYGNNGIVSDEYARKHPYRAMATNLAGDIATFGAASTLRPVKVVSPQQTVQVKQFIHPAEAAIPGKQYIKPTTERVSITTSEPLMASDESSMSSGQLLYKISKGKIGLKELTDMVGQQQAKWIMKEKDLLISGRGNQNKLNAILEKAAKGAKGKRGSNDAINKATQIEIAQTPKGRLKLIRDKYKSEIEKSQSETGIDWSDQNSVMASMPEELKLSAVGFDSKTPFLERYYKNVIEKVLGNNGIQKRLLKSGELRKNNRGQWEGLFEDGYRKVEPTEYIKMRIANEKGYNFDLEALTEGEGTNYPMHGTMTKNYRYLTRPSSSPGKHGYWTGIQDELGLKSGMIDYYKGKGASVPFFRMPDFELPIMKPNGINSSNSYGGSGQSLMDMLLKKPGKIQRPTRVSDPQGSGQPFNEYNFGPNVPNPKSMWNTLDFEPGAGPLAYNLQNNENNYA